MNINLLSVAAIFTLMLNLLLTIYMLKDKIEGSFDFTTKDEIVNFVLTPSAQKEIIADTEVIETEIMLPSNSCNE